MSLALSEKFRAQVEKPLSHRHYIFALFTILFAFPLSLVWAGVASWRKMRRVRAATPFEQNPDPWIISVGNVAVGGTGKSPIVRALAQRALLSGFDVAILLRGYGKEQAVPLIARASDSALFWNEQWSDESLEHAIALRHAFSESDRIWIAQGSERQQTLVELVSVRAQFNALEERSRALVVLLDDGLSQTSVAVHHDVIVWDPRSVIEAPRACLPFGPYRMGWPGRFWASSLPVADVVVWSRLVDASNGSEFGGWIEQARKRLARNSNETHSAAKKKRFEKSATREFVAREKSSFLRVVSGKKMNIDGFELEPLAENEAIDTCHILTGLARPQRFVQTLQTCVANAPSSEASIRPRILDVVHLADHGSLDVGARRLLASSEPVVTSLKDVCRWWTDAALIKKIIKGELFVLSLDVQILDAQFHEIQSDFMSLFTKD